MAIDAIKLGLALAFVTATLWFICSLLVAVLPGEMTFMSGHMTHTHLEHFSWHMSLYGFLVGLLAWSSIAFITGWLIGSAYNFLAKN